MKKTAIIILIFCMLLQSVSVFAAQSEVYVEGGNTAGCPAPDISKIEKGTDIDDITTTSINPWMKLYHLTTIDQAAAGFKGGECGQKCFALAAAPTNPDRVILGTDTEGLWRSEDGGLSWIPSNDGLTLNGAHYLCFSPDDDDVVFVTSFVNENPVYDLAATGIYKSTDGGKSWRKVLDGVFFNRMHPTCLIKYSEPDKNGKRLIYAAGNRGGVFKSEDDGETWTNIGLTDEVINSVNVIGGSVLACTQAKGLQVTYDGGKTWKSLNVGFEEENCRAVASDPLTADRWFAITPKYLYESTDSGQNWKPIYTPEDMGYGKNKSFVKLTIEPVNSNGAARMFLTSAGVQYPTRYSDDYGKTVHKIIDDNHLAIMRDNWGYDAEPYYVLPTNPDIMWISYDGQIMKSTDGGTTSFAASSGFSGMRAMNFYFDINGDENDLYVVTTDRSSMRSVYTGNDEDYPLVNYDPNEDRYPNVRTGGAKSSKSMAFDPKNPDRVLDNRGQWGANSTIKESLNGGLDWHNMEGTMGIHTFFMAFNPDNPTTIYAGPKISYDDGKTWTASAYSVVEMSPFNGNVVYAVGNGSVYKSTDEGRNWNVMCSGLPASGLQRVSVDLFKEDKLYVGTFSGGYIMVDGSTCTTVNADNGLIKTNNSLLPIYSVAQDPGNENHLVCGGRVGLYNYTTPGLFESYDGGKTWKNIPGIKSAADIWFVKFRASKKQVWIGTSGGTYVYEYENYFDVKDTLYTDIDDSYARDEIISLYDDGVYNEFTDGKFEPEGTTTRGEFAKLTAKLLNLERKGDVLPYADIEQDNVSRGGYYFPYVKSMYNFGLLAVADDAEFNPDENLTYEQLVIIAARILSAYHVTSTVSPDDVAKAGHIPSYARYAYARCVTEGIIDQNVSYEVNNPASNEDIAHVFYNLKNILKKAGGI